MKIIQHGKPKTDFNTIKRFKCDFCGCVFEADKGEYKVGTQYNSIYHQCKCPDCGKHANEVIMRENAAL